MIETLMKQLYFRGLRRRVEHLVAQRRETSPSEVYLYWIDGGDGNDPWMAIGPNGEEWYRGDPGPIPGIETSAGRASSSPTNPIPGIEDAAGREASSPTNPTPKTAIIEKWKPGISPITTKRPRSRAKGSLRAWNTSGSAGEGRPASQFAALHQGWRRA